MKHFDPPPETEIEPIAFRSDLSPRRSGLFSKFKWIKSTLVSLIVLFLIGLMGLAWFVFTARQVIIGIQPEPGQISIEGGILSPRFKNYYLLRPGTYALQAKKNGYHPLRKQIIVTNDKSQILNFTMEKLPGKISLTAHRVKRPEVIIDGAAVTLDGKEIGKTPVKEIFVKAGLRQLVIQAPKYKELKTQVTVEGMGQAQTFAFALLPGWADVTVRSIPEGADVVIDGRRKGKTPVTLELPEGTYELKLSVAQHKSRITKLTVKANQPKVLDPIRLEFQDGVLALDTQPSGARATIGDKYIGQTPVKIPLKPDVFHTIHLSKAGYKKTTRRIKIGVAEKRKIDVALPPEFGVIHLTVKPPDALFFVDGKRLGEAPKQLKIIAVEHTLEARKEGYEPFVTQITPRPGFPQQLEIVLSQKGQDPKIQPAVIRAYNGQTLALVRPKIYTMGSSRREQGRRSNESLRKIDLKRLFYMGTREVANKEFQKYLSTHNSGVFKTQTLSLSGQPVVQVTWKQAALFCNWLSKKEGLPPAYTLKGDKIVATEPLTIGYRLPTEAEWEYCARFTHSAISLKYPWGNQYPPTNKTVNIADISAKDILSATLDRYEDGYPVSSPSGAFASNDLGLYDLGGNVAEWCHDYYSIVPSSTQNVYLDPTGPKEGKHRIVRGSSWRHASISALRSAYRDYSNGKRPDLGFRICRYAR